MYTYNELNSYLGKKSDRPAPGTRNNTRVQKRDNGIVIKLHVTDIILFSPNGDISLFARDWQTITTKQRMNEYIPRGFNVYQERHVWYLADCRNGWQDSITYPFADGITIHTDGSVSGQGEESDIMARRKLNKAINKYAKEYAKEFTLGNIPAPSGADCFYCSMFESAGMHDSDHLLSHIEEPYFVPSLLNRVKESRHGNKLSSFTCGFIGSMWAGQAHADWSTIAQDQIVKALKGYLEQRLT